MSEGTRPGGLTALAVINFIFAGLVLIGVLFMGAVIASPELIDEMDDAEQEAAMREALENGMIYVGFTLSLLVGVALLVSGIGYLKQRRFMGRIVGNVYAILGLLTVIIGSVVGKSFDYLQLIDIVYPLLTLILLNTTFKDDLVH